MNSMIENLVIDMRQLGIKSLALELSDEGPDAPAPAQMVDRERDTLAPETESQPKDPALCVAPDCGEKNGGIFNGQLRQYCRTHALERAGVRT